MMKWKLEHLYSCHSCSHVHIHESLAKTEWELWGCVLHYCLSFGFLKYVLYRRLCRSSFMLGMLENRLVDYVFTINALAINIHRFYQRLQKLNVCTSHQVTSGIVDRLGDKHDATLLQWRDALLTVLENTAEVLKPPC